MVAVGVIFSLEFQQSLIERAGGLFKIKSKMKFVAQVNTRSNHYQAGLKAVKGEKETVEESFSWNERDGEEGHRFPSSSTTSSTPLSLYFD